jgi:two-component system response regulator (stage 0 sporulation protein A)
MKDKTKNRIEVFKIVTYYMIQMGFQARNKGYRYLRDAVVIGCGDRGLLESVTKRLYPILAEKYDVTVFQIESSIRNTIELAWEEGDPKELKHVLGKSSEDDDIRPTNSDVIERMVGFIVKTIRL